MKHDCCTAAVNFVTSFCGSEHHQRSSERFLA